MRPKSTIESRDEPQSAPPVVDEAISKQRRLTQEQRQQQADHFLSFKTQQAFKMITNFVTSFKITTKVEKNGTVDIVGIEASGIQTPLTNGKSARVSTANFRERQLKSGLPQHRNNAGHPAAPADRHHRRPCSPQQGRS